MDVQALRAQFPVLERVAYLNTGTDGPLPAAAVAAAEAALREEAHDGRYGPHFDRRFELHDRLREAYARVANADPSEIAVTTSTSDGLGRVIAGLGLGPDDEIVTSDQEHPGLVGPLLAARRRGVTVRAVPFAHVRRGGRAGHHARRAVACELGRRRGRAGRAVRARRAGDPRRRPGRRAPSTSTRARSAAPPMPRPARSGCAAPTARASCGSIPRSRRSSRSSPPATRRSRTRAPGWKAASSRPPRASTPRRPRARLPRSRSPRSSCWRQRAGRPCSSARSRAPAAWPTRCASAAAR